MEDEKRFKGYTVIFQLATPHTGLMWIYEIILSRPSGRALSSSACKRRSAARASLLVK